MSGGRKKVTDCPKCEGWGWVCENHPDKPWGDLTLGPNSCACGAGMPCECNKACPPWDFKPDRD